MRDEIIEILGDIKSGVDFGSVTDIISSGILTSLNIFTLVRELNDAFDVQIGADKLLPENFESVDAIEKLIVELQDE